MAVSPARTSAASTSDREVVVTRVLDAPRETVFDMWTDPKHIARWWGPNGFTNTIKEMDVRPGGLWRMVMHAPDGRDYNDRMVYQEILRPERLVYRHEPADGCEPVSCEVTVTFSQEGRRTRITMRMLFPSASERDFQIQRGVIQGGNQTLGSLAEHLVKMMGEANPELLIKRVLDAPRRLVYEAWTKPEHLDRWQGVPEGFTVTSHEVDLRPGGAFRICMRSPEGVDHWLQGVYREVVEPERLVFTHAWLGHDGKPGPETLVSITFSEIAGKTELILRQTGFKSTGARDGHYGGWSSTLDRFNAYILAISQEERS